MSWTFNRQPQFRSHPKGHLMGWSYGLFSAAAVLLMWLKRRRFIPKTGPDTKHRRTSEPQDI